jgi:hypothetical protein
VLPHLAAIYMGSTMSKDIHLIFIILIFWFHIVHIFITAADIVLGIFFRDGLLSGTPATPEVQIIFIIQVCGRTCRLFSAIMAEVIEAAARVIRSLH